MAEQAGARRRWAALALAAALGAVSVVLLVVLFGGGGVAGLSGGRLRSGSTAASTAKVMTAAASGARRWLRNSTARLAAMASALPWDSNPVLNQPGHPINSSSSNSGRGGTHWLYLGEQDAMLTSLCFRLVRHVVK